MDRGHAVAVQAHGHFQFNLAGVAFIAAVCAVVDSKKRGAGTSEAVWVHEGESGGASGERG